MAALIMTPRLMAVGGGALADLPGLMGRLGLARPLIVTDPYIAGCGILDRATALLDERPIAWAVFKDTVPDPTTDALEAGVARMRGGRLRQPRRDRRRQLDRYREGHVGALRQWRPDARLQGAERDPAGRAADHRDPDHGRHRLRGHALYGHYRHRDRREDADRGLACCPAAAIVDYELTLTMPLRLTADTGIDSLTHAIEAYVSRRANPFADGLAKNAMSLIARNIRAACAEPDNRAAREAMMLGATTAGMAFSNASVALVHGMSRPIGAFFHVPHGLSNAMLLPEITAFSAPAALDRYADCARAMGVADESEGSQATVARLVDELRRLNADLRVPSPREYGIDRGRYEELLPVMASQALASGSPANNPQVPTAEEVIELYRRVYD